MSTRSLALLLLLSVLVLACSFRRQPPPGASGDEIFRLQNCANCHGPDREGTKLGPPLKDLRAHWSAEQLTEFLVDPAAQVARDARLAAYEKAYGSSKMSPYANLDLDQRRTLSEWLLGPAEAR